MTPMALAERRAVPLQAMALAALGQLPPSEPNDLLFPAERGGYIDLHMEDSTSGSAVRAICRRLGAGLVLGLMSPR